MDDLAGLERHLLEILSVLLKRVSGGLALAVVLSGTNMAATTSIVGASVVMLALLGLPILMERGYDRAVAAGAISSSDTLGVLFPPSIMLVVMGDLLAIPAGDLFAGAVVPGLRLSDHYLLYIVVLAIGRASTMPKPAQRPKPRKWKPYSFSSCAVYFLRRFSSFAFYNRS